MSIQWTVIAGYLYFEIGIVTLMMLPIFSPRRWHQFFKSRLFALFQKHAAVYFYVLLGVLGLFLFDAIREMKKYSHGTESTPINLASELKGSVKLFRAQRNFYITGFSIFLAFVIRRLVNMLIIQDKLSLKAEKIIEKAEETVKFAKNRALSNAIDVIEARNDVVDNQALLEQETKKVEYLEQEVKKWKSKYEESAALIGYHKND